MTTAIANPEVRLFQHDMFGEIRIVDQDGQPWFIAKDVAESLGYVRTADAIRAHCKGVRETPTPSAGGVQLSKIIPESDVYRLVIRSNLPQAEKFQDWVVEEVLPQIRRTGRYQPEETYEQLMSRAIAATNERLRIAEQKVAEDAPKVEFHDRVTGSDTVCQLGVACQVASLPFGRNTLFRILREQGVLISTGDRKNHPRQEYVERGYFTVAENAYTDDDTGNTYVTFTTHVTQKGLAWLVRRFGGEGGEK